MTIPSSPLEAFQSAARTVLGRMIGFCVACSLGGGTGYIATQWSHMGEDWVFELLMALGVIPLALASFLISYGLIVFPLCLIFAFLFVRLELSFWWLLVPFALVAWQTSMLTTGN